MPTMKPGRVIAYERGALGSHRAWTIYQSYSHPSVSGGSDPKLLGLIVWVKDANGFCFTPGKGFNWGPETLRLIADFCDEATAEEKSPAEASPKTEVP